MKTKKLRPIKRPPGQRSLYDLQDHGILKCSNAAFNALQDMGYPVIEALHPDRYGGWFYTDGDLEECWDLAAGLFACVKGVGPKLLANLADIVAQVREHRGTTVYSVEQRIAACIRLLVIAGDDAHQSRFAAKSLALAVGLPVEHQAVKTVEP